MPFLQINDIPSVKLVEGYDARFVHTPNATYSHVRVAAGAILPLHAHFQEQVSYILEGKFQLTVNGEPFLLEPGQMFVIPSNLPHSGLAITDCLILDVFTPFREDYKEKGGYLIDN